MLALQGPQSLELVAAARAAPVRVHRGGGLRRARAVARTGYTGEPGVELIVAAERPAAAVGRAGRRRRRPRAGWARATPCGWRSATRCTATTCASSAPRSRPDWAGSARSTPRSSPAPPRCGGSARRGGYDRLVAFRMEERGIPRPGMAVLPAGEVTSGTMSPSLEIGIGMAYVPASSAETGSRAHHRRARPAARRAGRQKPLYVKERVA